MTVMITAEILAETETNPWGISSPMGTLVFFVVGEHNSKETV
jgi:hypothetical protein